ncbi:YheC/YheD family protein [Paenibacillus sediminis]|uniref:YheC/YheD family protein n=1 Tax=Paenibacillus sediminis TaxID=664909 RepID=A0ABS4H5S4_9BACL|nr:YheC/YheD family protein [Paenibacillus sediminis]MBP1937883.1 hypothetical protein [Paenibacillus sediminis]
MQLNYVGILLNSGMHRGIPRKRTGQESLSNYEAAAAMYGFTPCFLKLDDIHVGTGYSKAYVHDQSRYTTRVIPTPSVIHNRALYINEESHQHIQKLAEQGIVIFNMYNRYGKDQIHHLLRLKPEFSRHLPETDTATSSHIQQMMDRYDDLIIKPCNGSVGSGIMRLHYSKSSWKLTYQDKMNKNSWAQVQLRKTELPLLLLRKISTHPYLVQQRISLLEYNKKPFDLRVTVQRGIDGAWSVTGMFAKVAPANTFVTNIAQGGSVFSIHHILQETLGSKYLADYLIHETEQLVLQIAQYLSEYLPNIADLGIDIGISQFAEVYFIECNGRDQRYGFRIAQMHETWKNTYSEPIAYARYLLGQHNPIQL